MRHKPRRTAPKFETIITNYNAQSAKRKAQLKTGDSIMMFEVTLNGQVYWILAQCEDQAVEIAYEGSVEPIHESCEPNGVKKLNACRCGICRAYGYPWACQHSEPEDAVIDLGSKAIYQ